MTGETGTGFLQALQQEGCWKAPGALSESGLWTPGRGPPAVDVPTAASDLGTLSPQPWEAQECTESLLQQPSQVGGFMSPRGGSGGRVPRPGCKPGRRPAGWRGGPGLIRLMAKLPPTQGLDPCPSSVPPLIPPRQQHHPSWLPRTQASGVRAETPSVSLDSVPRLQASGLDGPLPLPHQGQG